MKRKKIYIYVCLILKYLFAMTFPVLAVVIHKASWHYIAVALAEILLIIFFTNLLCHIKTWLGYFFNVPALLFMNVQFAVLYWGNTFISVVMLANLDSLNAISGKAFIYGLSVIIVLLFSFLPVSSIPGKKTTISLGVSTVIIYFAIILTGSIEFSPYRAVYNLYHQMAQDRMTNTMVDDASAEGNAELMQIEYEFYSDSVTDYIQKPKSISENPNVILIFVEGMSQNIIDDSREITPNISTLQDSSISFANYYNHTFATYMALSGQLYSDYQFSNYDVNPLVSIQDVFKSYEYKTIFINTEPLNREFSEYLANFRFDELLSEESRIDGIANTLSDKSAYELLLETALKENEKEAPFFLVMYSFGTHAASDGVYEKFGDGSNALLNKFYDLDVQVGTFLAKFNESDLSDNTIIVLTSDHAIYKDADFSSAFPYISAGPSVDCIPLIIYHKGLTPKRYDVNGRNSLDLAPTILDFLDMSAPNYFWGDSLFSPESTNLYDTYFQSHGIYYCTANGMIDIPSEEQQLEFEKQLTKYYALKTSGLK